MRKSFKLTSALLVVMLAVSLGLWGCSQTDNSPVAPEETSSAGLLTIKNPAVQSVMVVQERHTPMLMASPGVIGTAVTALDNGKPAIMVLVTTRDAMQALPRDLDGVTVVPHLTDPIVAMKGRPGGGGGVDHKALQQTPIQLGTSGGWREDLANGFCCGGTLGSLIQVGGNKRVLSNYHVFEADIVPGGNGIVATTGDNIVHPGLIDIGCVADNGINVATLVVTSSLPNNNVDCSSANIISGQVDESGAILEVGTISASTVGAFVNQAVKKSGRTTGLSRASVSALNATVSITYDNECAGGTAFTKTFTGQIITTNRGSKFLAGGDSGSLMVEDVSSNPRAVGLLYAGSNTTAVANPIDDVLSFLGGSMVGQ